MALNWYPVSWISFQMQFKQCKLKTEEAEPCLLPRLMCHIRCVHYCTKKAEVTLGQNNRALNTIIDIQIHSPVFQGITTIPPYSNVLSCNFVSLKEQAVRGEEWRRHRESMEDVLRVIKLLFNIGTEVKDVYNSFLSVICPVFSPFSFYFVFYTTENVNEEKKRQVNINYEFYLSKNETRTTLLLSKYGNAMFGSLPQNTDSANCRLGALNNQQPNC